MQHQSRMQQTATPGMEVANGMIFFRKLIEPGCAPEETAEDPTTLRGKVAAAKLPEDAQRAAEAEIARMEKTDPSVAEYAIALGYVECLLSLPWSDMAPASFDLDGAARVFDASHAGLGQVRERVLEHLAAHALGASRPFSLLVVDDEPIARANLELVLRREGHHVEVAANGEEALRRFDGQEFDLVVSDLKMDTMDGQQLLEAIRERSPETQCIIVTGFATVDSAVRAMRSGAVHYLTKPIDLDDLRAAVADVLRGRRARYRMRAPLLCFVGPPGVGKTSVGQAIAKAMNRPFVRLSLADLRDEAELRGHRRTYAGAMPGRIMQALRTAGVRNPVFMLDEMDKMGQDARSDPAMALLELLDPEQNDRFLDRYVDLPFDLSEVMFIATANDTSRMRGPLLDRLEVVPFAGYSEDEKADIASRFLLPRQLREHGLVHPRPVVADEALRRIVRDYTDEAGVRGLERELARLCRKLARLHMEGHAPLPAGLDAEQVTALLGPARYNHDRTGGGQHTGRATGLVWSEKGGEVIFVEVSTMEGSGQLILTGSLGDVLKESARIALSHLRSTPDVFGLRAVPFDRLDIHIHIPAGDVAKDGPSAGVTIAAALVSRLAGRPARADVALSGELSLGGSLLPVSGIREKVLAAARGGARTVILPRANAPDVAHLRATVQRLPRIELVGSVSDALEIVLAPAAQPATEGGLDA